MVFSKRLASVIGLCAAAALIVVLQPSPRHLPRRGVAEWVLGERVVLEAYPATATATATATVAGARRLLATRGR